METNLSLVNWKNPHECVHLNIKQKYIFLALNIY